MARFQFPAKPGKFSLKKTRVSTKKLCLKSDRLFVAEKTGRFLTDFYALVGDSDEEQDESLQGFSTAEVETARQLYRQLQQEGDDIREELWLARGVRLDRRDREIIREKTTQALQAVNPEPGSSKPISNQSDTNKPSDPNRNPNKSSDRNKSSDSNKRKLSDTFKLADKNKASGKRKNEDLKVSSKPGLKPNKLASERSKLELEQNATRLEQSKQALERKKPGRKSADKSTRLDRLNKRNSSRTSLSEVNSSDMADSSELPEERKDESVRTRVQIEIPCWREVPVSGADWRTLPGVVEDTRDQVYSARHAKAEWEEQELWEKWQTMRTEAGKRLCGRSKSRRWREAGAGRGEAGAARRSSRVCSLQSEDSLSGRLSPRTESLREIVVSTAPPTPLPEEAPSPLPPPNQTRLSLRKPVYVAEDFMSFAKDFNDCDLSIEMPLSPPLSPQITEPPASPKSRRKPAGESTNRRTRETGRDEKSSPLKLEKFKSAPNPKPTPAQQKRGSLHLTPVPRSGTGRVEKVRSSVYPLRSQDRRTRQGARR